MKKRIQAAELELIPLNGTAILTTSMDFNPDDNETGLHSILEPVNDAALNEE